MASQSTQDVSELRIACIGAGAMGAGWVALFLANGFKVSVWDPAAGEATMQEIDFVIRNGPALRWPDTGPCEGEVDWIAPGGQASIDRERYEALMLSAWSRLQGPELTPEFESLLLGEIAALRPRSPSADDGAVAKEKEQRILAVMEAAQTRPL